MNHMKTAKGAAHAKPKQLSHLEVKEAEGGGHIVTHHFNNSVGGDGYHEPEQHVFGASEGHEALQHIAENVGINPEQGKAEEGEDGETSEQEEA